MRGRRTVSRDRPSVAWSSTQDHNIVFRFPQSQNYEIDQIGMAGAQVQVRHCMPSYHLEKYVEQQQLPIYYYYYSKKPKRTEKSKAQSQSEK